MCTCKPNIPASNLPEHSTRATYKRLNERFIVFSTWRVTFLPRLLQPFFVLMAHRTDSGLESDANLDAVAVLLLELGGVFLARGDDESQRCADRRVFGVLGLPAMTGAAPRARRRGE